MVHNFDAPIREAEALYIHARTSLAIPSSNCEDNQMRITRHRYKVKPEYGQTFLHLVTSQDDPSAVITGLPSFKTFQSELLASDPVVRPDQVGMSLVATNGNSYS